MEKRKVLIISCTPFYGGAEIFVSQVFPKLEEFYDLFFQVRSDKLYNNLSVSKKFFLDAQVSFFEEISFARKLIIREKIDVVILNGNRAIYMAPFLPTKTYKIAYKHSSSASTPLIKKGIYNILITLGFWCSHKIIGVSRMVVDEIKGFSLKKKVIYNGVFIPAYVKSTDSTKDRVRIVYVGRLEREKGIKEALDVIKRLSFRYSIVFNIAGTGVLYQEIKQKIEQEQIDNIHLLGQINNVNELLLNSDIFILPSYNEAFPLSVLEAMAYGLPVLTTRTGGIPEAVSDGVTGILVPPKDVNELSRGLEKLLMNTSMRDQMGKAGRAKAQELFNIEKTIESIDKLLKDIS